MTTETTNQLPPCPLTGCGGGDHHFHDVEAYAAEKDKTHDCAKTARNGYCCYGPHRPGLSEPIDLPEITDEMVDRAVVTYVNTYYAYDAGSRRAAMRAALTEFRADLIAGIPQWQPIEHAQIEAGMRIRATVQCEDRTTVYVGVAHHQAVGTRVWCTEGRWPLDAVGDSTIFEVDPSTIPDQDAELALDADWSAERDAVWDDVLATLTGDQITPEEYDLLMAPWRSVSGDE